MKNVLNREIPAGYTPFAGAEAIIKSTPRKKIPEVLSKNREKLIASIAEAFDRCNITDGMTLSFHHHLRNGDYVLNLVMEEVKRRGLKNMKIAASSIFPAHAPLCELIEDGTVTQIFTNYISGPVAQTICDGKMKDLLIMNTHGGRARSIESGELPIDVAFLAAPCCDKNGNANGTEGESACGALGYAIPDAMYAKKVDLVTDHLVDHMDYVEIDGKYVDYVVQIDKIGDSKGIVSGTTKVTKDPVGLKIARDTAKLLQELGVIRDGVSMQTGAGGTSLAVAAEVKKLMIANHIKGSFASGGITGYFVAMLEEGLLQSLNDVQCFDLEAVRSYRENEAHHAMSASKYGNPYEDGVVVNDLDFVILGATEIDLDFNVNVTTGSNGLVIGGSGGHSDTAYGADITVITTALTKSRMPIIKDHVTTVTTPGETVDVLVTERGIAINPRRTDLLEKLKGSKLNILPIEKLYEIALSHTGKPQKISFGDKVVGLVEYRDGSYIDAIYQLKK